MSSFESMRNFVEYFERRATEIDKMIAEGKHLTVTTAICSLVNETLSNCSRELYFVLLRGLRDKWVPFVDVDEYRRAVEERALHKLIRGGLTPGDRSDFSPREIEEANSLVDGDEFIYVGITKDVRWALEVCMRHQRYSSIASV